MSRNDLRIDVLGTDFIISTDEEPEYLEKLLGKYRQTVENVRQRTGMKDPLKIAVLTGFLLSDDLEKAGIVRETSQKEEQGEAEELTLGMISRLDETLFTGTSPEIHELAGTPEVSVVIDHEPSQTDTNDNKEFETEAHVSHEVYGINPSIFKLKNTVKNYAWGSPDWIPALIRQKNISRVPWAELWMGVHPSGPSHIDTGSESESGESDILLSELIEKDKETFLGKEIAESYGSLPFLFKILAAAKPLSIQVHPNLAQAGEGFERENREGIPLDAPIRNYRDPNQKSEIICALSPFAALCGFREAGEIAFLIEILSLGSEGTLKSGFEKLIFALKQEEENPYKAFISALFAMDNVTFTALNEFLKERKEQLERDFPEYKGEWGLCIYLASLFPGDPGIIAPLYLNIIELAPGEAMYLPPGIFHSYIKGLGVELMTDSDNVLRGGLSPKHVDPEELIKILNFSEYKPEILNVPDTAPTRFSYPLQTKEFSLSVMNSTGSAITYAEPGPSILLVTKGSLTVTEDKNQIALVETGDSCFILPGHCLEFSGTFTAYIASAGAVAGAEAPGTVKNL